MNRAQTRLMTIKVSTREDQIKPWHYSGQGCCNEWDQPMATTIEPQPWLNGHGTNTHAAIRLCPPLRACRSSHGSPRGHVGQQTQTHTANISRYNVVDMATGQPTNMWKQGHKAVWCSRLKRIGFKDYLQGLLGRA